MIFIWNFWTPTRLVFYLVIKVTHEVLKIVACKWSPSSVEHVGLLNKKLFIAAWSVGGGCSQLLFEWIALNQTNPSERGVFGVQFICYQKTSSNCLLTSIWTEKILVESRELDCRAVAATAAIVFCLQIDGSQWLQLCHAQIKCGRASFYTI